VKNHIEPQEAAKLADHLFTSDITEARAMAMAYFKKNPFDMKNPDYSAAKCFAAVFNAGRIDGIRSERAKRKAVQV